MAQSYQTFYDRNLRILLQLEVCVPYQPFQLSLMLGQEPVLNGAHEKCSTQVDSSIRLGRKSLQWSNLSSQV